MNTCAIGNKTPVIPFPDIAMFKARIPTQRHNNGSTVREIDFYFLLPNSYPYRLIG
jgi:hypothetical protein